MARLKGPSLRSWSARNRSGKGAGHVVPTLPVPRSAFVYDSKGGFGRSRSTPEDLSTASSRSDRPNTVRWNPLFEVRKGRMEVAEHPNVVGISSTAGV